MSFRNSTTLMVMPTAIATTRSNAMVSANVSTSTVTALFDAVLHRCTKFRQPHMP